MATADSSTGSRLPFTVCVEGNIGSGKSTFLARCQLEHDITVFPEPVADWANVDGTNLLALFYSDPATWGMTFQMYVTLTMLQTHLRSTDTSIKIMERSLLSARHCFVENMLTEGALQPGMYNVLQEWYQFISDYHQPQIDMIIYLRTSPEVAYARLLSRGRPEEVAVPLGLITSLHALHEQWIQMERDVKGTPVIIIDADQELIKLQPQFDDCIASLYTAVETLSINE